MFRKFDFCAKIQVFENHLNNFDVKIQISFVKIEFLDKK